MRRALLALAALAALATTAASCLSPTLPLPPPDHPDAVSASPNGLWQISGTCIVGATVIVTNAATGRGAYVEDRGNNGTYTVAIAGKACDPVWVTQRDSAADESSQTNFVLQAFANGAALDPTSCP